MAVDLPCEDPDATLDDYAQAVVDGAAGFDEPVIVVGHSLGGLTIALIPSRRPVAGLVFVAAILPAPGELAGAGLGRDAFSKGFPELTAAHQVAEENGASRWDREGAVAAFYHDVPEERLDAATDALRLQQWGPTREEWPLDAYPDVPMRYVACADDASSTPTGRCAALGSSSASRRTSSTARTRRCWPNRPRWPTCWSPRSIQRVEGAGRHVVDEGADDQVVGEQGIR